METGRQFKVGKITPEVERGLHNSALYLEDIKYTHMEKVDKMKAVCSNFVDWDEIKDKLPQNLNVSSI